MLIDNKLAQDCCATVGRNAMGRAWRAGCGIDEGPARQANMVSACVSTVQQGRKLLLGAGQPWMADMVKQGALTTLIEFVTQVDWSTTSDVLAELSLANPDDDMLAAYQAAVAEINRAA